MAAVSLSGVPIPHATVSAAPAASPDDVVRAQLVASGQPPVQGSVLAAVSPPIAPAAGAGPSGVPLDVPADFRARLDAAVTEGRRDALAFARDHRPSERWMVVDWAMLKMAWPPKSDKEELAFLHEVAGSRTDAGIARARFWAEHGMTDEWERLLDDYARKAGPVQARRARKLLHDTLMMMNSITQTAKAGAARDRPFVVDPSLPLAVDRPGNNPSYPSGHTSAAYAACLVLSHLMPDRRAEFMALASEASWARVYSGVHFPTDVMAGAKLAATVATHLSRVSGTRPVTGTASVNSGVAGGRRALPGSPTLGGTPIAPGVAPSHAAPVMRAGQPGT